MRYRYCDSTKETLRKGRALNSIQFGNDVYNAWVVWVVPITRGGGNERINRIRDEIILYLIQTFFFSFLSLVLKYTRYTASSDTMVMVSKRRCPVTFRRTARCRSRCPPGSCRSAVATASRNPNAVGDFVSPEIRKKKK